MEAALTIKEIILFTYINEEICDQGSKLYLRSKHLPDQFSTT